MIKNRNSLTVIQLNDNHAYFDLHQEMFRQGGQAALWGANSYNNGAGMNRLLTSAAFIHSNMPLGTVWNPPAITNEDTYDVAAYLSSKERPQMSGLEKDYPKLEKKRWTARIHPMLLIFHSNSISMDRSSQ
jgi:cytochrome c